MDLDTVKSWLEVSGLVAGALLPVGWALLERRVEARVRRCLAEAELHELPGRTAALEWWRDQNASNVNAIPRTMAVLERLDGTLSKLNETMESVNTRVARIEGQRTRGPSRSSGGEA